MGKNFEIRDIEIIESDLINFGPIDPATGWGLKIPQSFEARVDYSELGLEVKLSCRFKNQKVEIQRLQIAGTDIEVTSRALTQLALPDLIHEVTWSVVPESSKWSLKGKDERLKIGGLNGRSVFLAQLYWLEHVSSGTPRAAIMEYLGAPRPTVNQWLREFKKHGLIPSSTNE
jgi:CRP-like cAMP-binding protein